ncbi:MAG: toxin-antitoxin system YwqK family antitoxin [Flavipsychrobacter sp.]
MNKKTIFGLLLTGLFISATDNVSAQSFDTLRRKDKNGWEFLQIRDGKTVMQEGHLHNGKIEGVWILFWDSGFPRTISSYVNGEKDGITTGMTGDGQMDFIEHYKEDKLEGPRRTYHIRGPIYEETYYSEGKKHGKYTKWYKTGLKEEEGMYVDGKREGKATWYYQEGGKAVEYEYSNDEIDGESIAYYRSGKVSEMGKFKKGKKTGMWREFYDGDEMKAEGKYVDNEKEGAWKLYDENGKVTTVKYKNGVEVK